MTVTQAPGEFLGFFTQQVDALQQQSEIMAPRRSNPAIDSLREMGQDYQDGSISEEALCYGAMSLYWHNQAKLQDMVAGDMLSRLGHDLAATASLSPEYIAYLWESASHEPQITATIRRARATRE